jgi:signal transduction histidine kinase
MTRYINDLLDTTRIETGKLNVQLEAVELQPLLERVAASFRPSMKEKEIVIRLNAPHTPLVACLDTTRITQVLNNLLSNARKYTPPGPGSDRFSSRVWA